MLHLIVQKLRAKKSHCFGSRKVPKELLLQPNYRRDSKAVWYWLMILLGVIILSISMLASATNSATPTKCESGKPTMIVASFKNNSANDTTYHF